MIRTLLQKELQQHLKVMLSALLMFAAAQALTLIYMTDQEAPSLMRTAGTTIRWVVPALAMLIARRLFVLERRQGTWELLSALPLSPLRLTGTKLCFGLLTLFIATSGLLLSTSALISRRELIAADWLFVMHLQCLSYAFAWFGITSLLAHLGKHRLVGWCAMFIFIGMLENLRPEFSKSVFWFESVSEPLDSVRYAPPWTAMFVSTLWGLFSLALCMLLSAYRGGAIVQGWYTRMTGRQRASAAAFIAFALLGSELLAKLVTQPSGLHLLPKVGKGPVRAAADPQSKLWKHAERLDAELLAVGEQLGIQDWPQITLSVQGSDRRIPVRARGDSRALILAVDLDADATTVLRRGLFEALAARTNYLVHWNESSAWIAKGFAEFWLRRRGHQSPGFALRAAWAASRGLSPKELGVWSKVELAVGEDISEAVAWVGLEALAAACDEACVHRTLQEMLSVWRPKRGISVALQRAQDGPAFLERTTGQAWQPLLQRWQEALQKHQTEQAEALLALAPPQAPPLKRAETASAAVSLVWPASERLEELELWWSSTSALAAIPIPQGQVRNETLKPQQTEKALAIDPSKRIVATFAQKSAALGGWMIFGWKEIEP